LCSSSACAVCNLCPANRSRNMFDWNRIRLIAGREIKTRVAMSSYKWSLIIQVVIVALLAASPVVIAKFTGGDDGPAVRSVAVVNTTDVDAISGLNVSLDLLTVDTNTTWELAPVDTEEEARAQLEDGDVDAAK